MEALFAVPEIESKSSPPRYKTQLSGSISGLNKVSDPFSKPRSSEMGQWAWQSSSIFSLRFPDMKDKNCKIT
jgi:hypothetical protein